MLTKYKNLHLVVSSVIIIVISLAYCLISYNSLPGLFDFRVVSVDLAHVFRAIMGLYLGMVILWVIGILKPAYWRTATISNVVFMTGLAAGRVTSLLLDGTPSLPFSVGLVLELILGLWGIRNLNKYRLTTDQ